MFFIIIHTISFKSGLYYFLWIQMTILLSKDDIATIK